RSVPALTSSVMIFLIVFSPKSHPLIYPPSLSVQSRSLIFSISVLLLPAFSFLVSFLRTAFSRFSHSASHPLIHSLCIFLLKQDPHGQEQKADIQPQGIIVNIDQIIFDLIFRTGAVLP